MRLVDADTYDAEMRIRRDACKERQKDALDSENDRMVYMTSSALSVFGEAKLILDKMPTIDAVPVRHGKWIGVEYDGYADGNPVYDVWKCSECGEEHYGDDSTLTHYCSNCGAKMDGKE